MQRCDINEYEVWNFVDLLKHTQNDQDVRFILTFQEHPWNGTYGSSDEVKILIDSINLHDQRIEELNRDFTEVEVENAFKELKEKKVGKRMTWVLKCTYWHEVIQLSIDNSIKKNCSNFVFILKTGPKESL